MAWTTTDIPDLTGRVAVVTGANGGLGLESARALRRGPIDVDTTPVWIGNRKGMCQESDPARCEVRERLARLDEMLLFHPEDEIGLGHGVDLACTMATQVESVIGGDLLHVVGRSAVDDGVGASTRGDDVWVGVASCGLGERRSTDVAGAHEEHRRMIATHESARYLAAISTNAWNRSWDSP